MLYRDLTKILHVVRMKILGFLYLFHNRPSRMDILELKRPKTEIKDSMDGLNSRMEMAQEKKKNLWT